MTFSILSMSIGVIIGAVLGLTGAGGSIFAVPLLILLLGLSPTDAMGLALAAVALGALLGGIAQRNDILWLPTIILALSGSLSAPLGKYAALFVSDSLLIAGFALIAIIIATRMLAQSLKQPESTKYVRAHIPEYHQPENGFACRLSPTGQFQLRPRCLSALTIGGILIGFASGLFGVGGGFLIVPLLLFLSKLPMPKAIATSLAIITLISGSGFAAHLTITTVENTSAAYSLLLNVLLGAALGMVLSQRFASRLAGPRLQQAFAVLLVLVVLFLLSQHFYSSLTYLQ